MKRLIINTRATGLSVDTQYLPYPVPYLSCHNKSTILMPVSSNSRVAKFIRETNIKDPFGVLYTLFHRYQGKKHKTPAQTHEKNYVQSIRTTCSSSWFHSIFYFRNRSTSYNFEHTRARHKLQLPRQRTKPGKDEFITSPWRGDYASGWPTLSHFHYDHLRNEQVEPLYLIHLQSPTCAELATMLAQRVKNPKNKFNPNKPTAYA